MHCDKSRCVCACGRESRSQNRWYASVLGRMKRRAADKQLNSHHSNASETFQQWSDGQIAFRKNPFSFVFSLSVDLSCIPSALRDMSLPPCSISWNSSRTLTGIAMQNTPETANRISRSNAQTDAGGASLSLGLIFLPHQEHLNVGKGLAAGGWEMSKGEDRCTWAMPSCKKLRVLSVVPPLASLCKVAEALRNAANAAVGI